MAAEKKTAQVDVLLKRINDQIARETTTDARKALCNLLESILFDANRYHGYNHIYWSREGGFEAWQNAGSPEGQEKMQYMYGPGATADDYRRYYY